MFSLLPPLQQEVLEPQLELLLLLLLASGHALILLLLRLLRLLRLLQPLQPLHCLPSLSHRLLQPSLRNSPPPSTHRPPHQRLLRHHLHRMLHPHSRPSPSPASKRFA
jgi:hypothetical protein